MNKIIINNADTIKRDCTIYDKQGKEYIVKEAIINEQKELWIKVDELMELTDYYSCKDSVKFSVTSQGELKIVMEIECEDDEYIPVSVTLTPHDADRLRQFLNDKYGEVK